jgi:hypothetical protein
MISTLIRVIVTSVVLTFSISPVVAQYHERALERAREVRMLTDGRGEVRKAFYDFNLSSSDETSDEFSFGDTEIEVTYSDGECGEEDGEEIWNVPIGKVIGIKIVDHHEWNRDALKLDLSKLEKEQRYAGNETDFVFSDKKAGVAVEIDDDKVESVMLFPPVNSKAKACKNDFARDFINEKSWFGKVKLKDRGIISCSPPPSVAQLELGHFEISALTSKQIDVKAIAVDPENDILTYVYTVTGGRIIGTGATVKWDLTGVRSGTYTITAGVDDGCGLCGQTVTKTVIVR